MKACAQSRTTGLLKAVCLAVLLAVFLMVAGWLFPGMEAAEAQSSSSGEKIAAFEDVTIGPDQTWEHVVVVGGDVDVQGTIEDRLVVVGGNIDIGPQARVGTDLQPDDTAIVSVFGDVNIQPGAQVTGKTVDAGPGFGGDGTARAITDPVTRTWETDSIINWAWSTVLTIVLGLIVVAIAPRQVAAVRDRIRYHFWSSLGWGALGAIVAVPIISIILIVTIIGILLLIPWWLVALPLLWLFGLTAVGAWIGNWILRRRGAVSRGSLMWQVGVGLLILSIIRWIPWGGAVIFTLLGFVGFGAAFVALWKWLWGRGKPRSVDPSAGYPGGRPPSGGYPSGGLYTPPPAPPGPPPPTQHLPVVDAPRPSTPRPPESSPGWTPPEQPPT